jgi:phage gp46-like protein
VSSDIKLTQDGDGIWDIDFADGDFELTDGLDTAVYMSVLSDKRASVTEVKDPILRRGHFTNEFSDVEGYQVGSKLWLYTDQAKNTEDNELLTENSVTDGLKWMIEDNIISKSQVIVTRGLSRVNIEVDLTSKTREESNYYNMFINTFR